MMIQTGYLTDFKIQLPCHGFAISRLEIHLKIRKSGTNTEPTYRKTSEPIDIVYTWVNGSDPAHEAAVRAFERTHGYSERLKPNRFEDWNTMKYSLRSIEKYANWTRHTFIVTNGQIPCWLNLSNPSVSIVTHEEIFKNKSHLPTFSSPAIESNIHRIKGLSKRFIYFNDDLFLTAPVSMKDFYEDTYGYQIRLDPNGLRDCSETCKQTDVNNGVCDEPCFQEQCDWDVDDCANKAKPGNNFKSKMQDDETIWQRSMLHSSYQLNKRFSPRRRHPPVHAPLLIDQELLTQVMNSFPEKWEQTSSHQVRHYNDMQYQFAYVHYLQELSNQSGSNVKTKRVTDIDYKITRITEDIKSLPSISAYQQDGNRNIKFAMLGDTVEKKLTKDWKTELQTKIDEVFTKLFPNLSSYEIRI